MKISIYTPTNDESGNLLRRAYQSIWNAVRLEDLDWEWIVIRNGDAKGKALLPGDVSPRVQMFDHDSSSVGELKRFACEKATGNLLVELDHDDELRPASLTMLHCAAETNVGEKAELVLYSDCAQVDEHGVGELFDAAWGWEGSVDDGLLVQRTPRICARNLCEIFYAPNHVRAWTRAAYDAAGGYDGSLAVCDDHDLLIRSFLKGARFVGIPHCLYVQHASQSQTQVRLNELIQSTQALLRRKYLHALVQEEARRGAGLCLDLGGAHGARPARFVTLDAAPGAKIRQSVFDALHELATSSVFCIRAVDFLEHIHASEVVHLMNEIHRVLKPGGWLLTRTPSTDGRGAWQDPTHVSFWNQNSWWYYTRPQQAKYVPGITARYQAVDIHTHYPTTWHEQEHIPYVDADLLCLKGQPVMGQDPWRGQW